VNGADRSDEKERFVNGTSVEEAIRDLVRTVSTACTPRAAP